LEDLAKIVAGFGTSYSPQLQLPVEDWPELGRNDVLTLLGGKYREDAYQELVRGVPEDVVVGIDPLEQARRHNVCQSHVQTISRRLSELELDALILLAEDEQGLLDLCGGPEVLVFGGARVPYRFAGMPTGSSWVYGEESVDFTGAPDIADLIYKQLRYAAANVSTLTALPGDRGIGHHIGFVNTRLLGDRRLPILPLLFNSARLPDPITAYRIGENIATSVAGMPGLMRIGVLAVGGLSHIKIDEELDRTLLSACKRAECSVIASLPCDGGTHSHGHNRPWLAAAGAMSRLRMELLGYVPMYRSVAATGCGLAFASWTQEAHHG
jgi:3-O-methylgallate 3,4-dioxygenase